VQQVHEPRGDATIGGGAEDCWIVSVDDHVVEPPHVWQTRVSAKLRDDAPLVVPLEDGSAWRYEGRAHPIHGMLAVVNKPPSQWTAAPVNFDDFPPGAYDPVAREHDMLADGVIGSMLFPSFPRFAGQLFSESKDKDLGFACIQAFNDWMIEEWCAAVPGRYIPLVIIPFWDPALAVNEVTRCVEKGARAVAFSENPFALGWPSIHDKDRYWDPLFAVVSEADVPLCSHVGSSSRLPITAPDASPLIPTALNVVNSMSCLADWLLSGNFERFPSLKLCLSEGGIGWIPVLLRRLERVISQQAEVMLKVGLSGLTLNEILAGKAVRDVTLTDEDLRRTLVNPYQLFCDHVYGCFIDDPTGIALIDQLPADNIMIETDYPHPDCTFPRSRSIATESLAALEPVTRQKILAGNASRVFRFTPAPPPS
jgi:predicted TIM-barrel fold metal-dependent hydrolase